MSVTHKPRRIQRKRSAGWRMPEGAVYVGRPGKWGNPFKLEADMIYTDASNRRGTILSQWVFHTVGSLNDVIEFYRKWLVDHEVIMPERPEWGNVFDKNHMVMPPSIEDVIRELRGKDLVCWCREGLPCHADILLEIANG